MPVEAHRGDAPRTLGYAVVTVSSSRDVEHDLSGDRIIALVEDAGQRAVERIVETDDIERIRSVVSSLLARTDVDVVIVNGGTGFSPTDVTTEALEPLFDRPVPGFGELFRALSFEAVGAAAMLSRAVAGIVGRKAVFALPGSPSAVELGMSRLVLPETAHLIGQVRRVR